MFPSKKPENFDQLVERIAAGELTRKQAAAEADINFGTFKGWLTRTGAIAKLRHTRLNFGENSHFSNAKRDPKKAEVYKEAVTKALQKPKVNLQML